MRHEWDHSVFPLNDCLGNRNGHFLWGGQGFKQSDRNTSLRDGRYLQVELCNMWGGWGATPTDLESCISNDDGNLWPKDDKVEYLLGDIWNGANCYIVSEASGTCLNLVLFDPAGSIIY